VALCALAATAYLRKWIPALIAAALIASLWVPPTRSVLPAFAMSALVIACVVALRITERRSATRPTRIPQPLRPASERVAP
jgi:hypothetical protein